MLRLMLGLSAARACRFARARRDLFGEARRPDLRALHCPRHHLGLRARRLPGLDGGEPAGRAVPVARQARRPSRQLSCRRPRVRAAELERCNASAKAANSALAAK